MEANHQVISPVPRNHLVILHLQLLDQIKAHRPLAAIHQFQMTNLNQVLHQIVVVRLIVLMEILLQSIQVMAANHKIHHPAVIIQANLVINLIIVTLLYKIQALLVMEAKVKQIVHHQIVLGNNLQMVKQTIQALKTLHHPATTNQALVTHHQIAVVVVTHKTTHQVLILARLKMMDHQAMVVVMIQVVPHLVVMTVLLGMAQVIQVMVIPQDKIIQDQTHHQETI
jgi:hypothetical protein